MMNWIEIVATVFGFMCVVLTIRRNVWCWPTGLIQVLLFIIIFYDAKLYSDLILHVVYVGMQFYGWYCWTIGRGGIEQGAISISALTTKQLGIWIYVTTVATAVWGYSMATWTDASLPYADAFTTVASLVAQYLLARKYIENWLFWIVVDVVAIGVYYYKALVPTSILYSAFLVLAVIGFVTWRIKLQAQQEQLQAAGGVA